MTTKFTPTKARGAALARLVLDEIEHEAKLAKKRTTEPTSPTRKNNAWDQRHWSVIRLDRLAKSLKFRVQERWNESERTGTDLIAPAGLTCGTAMCFAGHASALVGDQFVTPTYALEPGEVDVSQVRSEVSPEEYGELPEIYFSAVITATGEREHIEDRARELLELTRWEANAVFNADNTLDQLRAAVKAMEMGTDVGAAIRAAAPDA